MSDDSLGCNLLAVHVLHARVGVIYKSLICMCMAGDGYIALEFPSEGCSPSPHLMGSADEDKTEYVVKMPPLTFLRHFRQVSTLA